MTTPLTPEEHDALVRTRAVGLISSGRVKTLEEAGLCVVEACEIERLRVENARLREQNARQTAVFFDVETALIRDGRWTLGIDGPSVWQRIESDRREIQRLRAALEGERDAS